MILILHYKIQESYDIILLPNYKIQESHDKLWNKTETNEVFLS